MKKPYQNLQARYRYTAILLRQLVVSDFKLRYQGSVLGYLWSLLRPLAIFTILYVVFVRFLKVGAATPYFSIYLLTGIVLWNFFIEVTSGSLGSIVARGDILRKLSFPRYVIVLSASFSALINLTLNTIVVGIFLFFSGVEIRLTMFVVPLLVLQLYIFGLGLAFFLSAMNVRFRDIGYIWEVIIQGAFYATPILYPVSLVVAESLFGAKIIMLNPVAQIIQDVRYAAVTEQTHTINTVFQNDWIRLMPVTLTLITFTFGAFFFRKRSKYFAEEI